VDKRRYGYYVLTVMYSEHFIARCEPLFDKNQGALLIKNGWWETGFEPERPLLETLQECFNRFKAF
jgi:uncharacterized protein